MRSVVRKTIGTVALAGHSRGFTVDQTVAVPASVRLRFAGACGLAGAGCNRDDQQHKDVGDIVETAGPCPAPHSRSSGGIAYCRIVVSHGVASGRVLEVARRVAVSGRDWACARTHHSNAPVRRASLRNCMPATRPPTPEWQKRQRSLRTSQAGSKYVGVDGPPRSAARIPRSSSGGSRAGNGSLGRCLYQPIPGRQCDRLV
jgi:hypothetical protein